MLFHTETVATLNSPLFLNWTMVEKKGSCCSSGACNKNAPTENQNSKQVSNNATPPPANDGTDLNTNAHTNEGGCAGKKCCDSNGHKDEAHSHDHSHKAKDTDTDEHKSHGHSHNHNHTDEKAAVVEKKSCCSHDHAPSDSTAKEIKKPSSCSHSHSDEHSHSHSHDHDHGHAHNNSAQKKQTKIESKPHDKPNCVAIVRENGFVDVYDTKGQVKSFTTGADHAKICFSSHGHNVDEFLTPCFDDEGLHGEPDEGCFCGIDTPHLHAHVHNDKTCKDKEGNKSSGGGDGDLTKLAKLTLYPVEADMEQAFVRSQSMPVSDSLPNQCNSKEMKKSLSFGGADATEKYSSSRQNVFKVEHTDHYDTLVHNAKTGNMTLEHDCNTCGDRDVHGSLILISKRSWNNPADVNAQKSDGKIKMNFYEIPKAPLKILDLLSDFFAMDTDTDRVKIVRSAFPHSPGRDSPRKVPSCCASGTCDQSTSSANEGGNAKVKVAKGQVRSTIHVKQICCAAEIPMINSIVKPIPGVSNVNVSTTTKLVHVTHDPAITTASEITDFLNKQKFGATLKKDGAEERKPAETATSGKSSFFVSGICCAAEIPAINTILEPLKGVQKVTINVPNKTVYVYHEFALISASDIKDALDAERFDCRISKDAGSDTRLKSTVMSKFVESTFLISALFEQGDAEKIKHVLREQYTKEQLSHSETHVPSKTIKIDHNPQLLSADTLNNFLKGAGFDISLVADGFVEGIWSAGEDADRVEEQRINLQWHIILSGVFWIISMLHLIGGNWDYLKYAALVSVALGIPKIAMKAYLTMKRRQFDTNCMMLFASIGALALQEFSEAAAVTFLFSISDWLETLSTTRARNALSAIAKLRPERAKVKDPVTGNFVIVPASSVPVGSIVSVRTGDKIPCDGKVVEGKSVVDESSLTGESRPVQKVPGNEVSGGTVNAGLAQLLIQTTSTVDDSAVARLIRLVEDAQANRSPTEKLVDEFAKRYTPLVILLAISMCTFPWIAGLEIGREWTKIGLVTIVIACPCALIISTPVTYVAGLAAAAQSGIVVKGGAHLEVRFVIGLRFD